jgi:excisionase family DNA binding protein
MIAQTLTSRASLPSAEEKPTLVPLTLSVSQAAAIIGVSEPTIYRLIARRLLKILPGLRHKRITRRSIDAYCAGAIADC